MNLEETDERMGLPSASALDIAVNCAGQPNLKRSLPPEALAPKKESESDEQAERGTRIHAAFETGKTDDLDTEELETYLQGVKFEEAIVQNWMRDKDLADAEEGPRELRVWLNNPNTLEPIGSAKPDRHYLSPPHMLVIDLKSGWNPNLPPSAHSWQLRFQAVVLNEEYKDRGITNIRVGYCKPKSSYGATDVCDYTQQDLEQSLQSIIFHLWETTQPDAPRHAGPHCNWCPCKPYCVEAGAYAMLPTVIARRSDPVGLMNWEQMVQAMSGDDLVRVWENSSLITKIMDAVKGRLKAMPDDQLLALGIKRGTPRKLDAIGAVASAFDFLKSEGIPEAELLGTMQFGKGALVERIAKHLQCSRKDADAWWNTKLDAYIVRGVSEAPLAKLK